MNSGEASIVLLDLPEADRAKASAALEAAGIASAPLDSSTAFASLEGALRGSEGAFLLIEAERWERLRESLPPPPRPYKIIVLLPPEREESAAKILDSGAFDYLVGGVEGWAERAAIYFRALIALGKRYEGDFSALERRYEDLVRYLPDIVYELDSEGRFTFINNSIRLLGYDPSELLGRHFSILLNKEDAGAVDRAAVLETFQGVPTGPSPGPKLFNERRGVERRTENLEIRLKRKAGGRQGEEDMIATVISYGEALGAGDRLARPSGRDFMGSVGVITDITMRRKSEETLRKLFQAVDQLSTGILVSDRSFRIEYVNPGFIRIAGLSPQEVIGSELFSFFDLAPGKAEEIRALVLEGLDPRVEARLCRGPWTALHASPVRSPSGAITHAILICEDIGKRKAMEELVCLAKGEAELANAAKSDFLASMSHELKSPVASVLAAARLIEMGGPEPERRAASIISSAQGLLDMLGDILDFVRFETGSGIFRRYSFPLAGFVARACEPFAREARSKGLSFDIAPIAEETLHSDPDRLGRAFAAVLDNAVSFTESGGIKVDAKIERRQGNAPCLTLTVEDSGPGIRPEDQARIFSPFVQLASPYTKRGGAGIGLSLARNIVRALGGEVRILSEAGRGSIFTIIVPVGDPEAQAAAAPAARRAYRLLVVDDNEVNLEYMAAILANAGHRSLTATSGAKALLLLEERPPDAAILDIQMPGMSGIELGRKIRGYTGNRYDPNLPMIALTAFGPEEVGRSGVDFDGVFDKPVEVPRLLAFLDQAIDRREAPSASSLKAYWADRRAEGESALGAALDEYPGLVERIEAALASGDLAAMTPAAQALEALLSGLGDEKGAAGLRRIALALPIEDSGVLACRMERLERNWELALGALGSLFGRG